MTDAFGNYVAGLVDDGISFATSFSDVLSGTGAPANSLGSNGNVYVDNSTGAIYTKSGDVWLLVSGGSGVPGATGGVFTGAGSPEGVVTAPVGSIYNQVIGGVFVQQWIKQSGAGNVGWV